MWKDSHGRDRGHQLEGYFKADMLNYVDTAVIMGFCSHIMMVRLALILSISNRQTKNCHKKG